VLLCGSPGEVANDAEAQEVFSFAAGEYFNRSRVGLCVDCCPWILTE
jgi:hypothetical protein